MVQTVLKLYHESSLAGHGDIQDTIERIKEQYYFDRLAIVVSDFVHSCHACQSRKKTSVHLKNRNASYPAPADVDLNGPLPCTSRGNSYLFTAV